MCRREVEFTELGGLKNPRKAGREGQAEGRGKILDGGGEWVGVYGGGGSRAYIVMIDIILININKHE